MAAVLDLQIPEDVLARRGSVDRALVVDHVTKRFGGPSRIRLKRKPAKQVMAVDDVSFEVKRGEIYGILGANGSGKSTLIRLLATLLLPDSGSARVFDLDVVKDAGEVKRLINRVSVEASMFKKLSAMENLIYAARLYGLDITRARKDVVRILTGLGISESRIGQPVEKMSRGMQQKVAIARALLTSPVLLLLDEPTTGLDPRSKKDVESFVLSLRSTHDATILLTSHDMHEADTLCDRLAIVDKGRIVVEGTPDELKEAHRLQQGMATRPSLEDVFMEVTGRSLDEDEDEDEDGGS
ncbi:MAG TPA: ABC transporter ATP-binding protein [Chloroflexota bacterium]|jgi:ABC-2 type transport system ATP-binding protein|nr:ABC transporter ATP-binding protein [Chloroflexota bacterium]